MAENGRSVEDVRQDIAAEREQLARALDDLRKGLKGARKIPALAGGALAAGAAVVAALVAVKRRRRGT